LIKDATRYQRQMEAELSETELIKVMNTCANSALKPDGIPYSTYK
jgi:hypothetical protein